ncbi:MAG: cupredoxin domain-containing protein [Acidobacteria bacterium]|nr:cupredoxin domain-containing protein [Acidobacteriota bacterium]
MNQPALFPKMLRAFCFLAALSAWVGSAAGQEQSGTPTHEIRMTVKKYEYQPHEIRVKQGERVRLLLTALDRKHGFQIKELGIKTDVEKDKETVVEFVAPQAGEFQFKCSVFCGLGHRRVKGTLIVEPASSSP